MKPLTRLLNTVEGRERPLRILGVPTHERYESGLALVGHEHYCIQGPGYKTWDATYAPVPPNYTICPPDRMPIDVDFDLVLCQSRAAHFNVLKNVAQLHRLPLVCLEHVLPNPKWPAATRRQMTAMRGDVNVFISEYSRDAWGFASDGVVIEHGVDAELFRPRDEVWRYRWCLSVVNDWKNRDAECGYKYWLEATDGLPTRVLGKTPGLSEPAQSLEHLAAEYASAGVFLNTAQLSPIPSVVLEAMASGCCVVSTRNPMLESILVDGMNGWLVGTPAEMRAKAAEMLADGEAAAEIGANARETVLARFGLGRFVDEWAELLHDASKTILEV